MLYTGSQPKIHDVVSGCDVRDLDGNSAISESFQADKVEKSEIVDQEPSEYVSTVIFYQI